MVDDVFMLYVMQCEWSIDPFA